MNVQKISQNVRLQEWMQRIKESQESGLSINEWCRQNDIQTGSYYYWLNKIRNIACEYAQESNETSLVKVAIESQRSEPSNTNVVSNDTVAVLVKNGIRIELTNSISKELLKIIMDTL